MQKSLSRGSSLVVLTLTLVAASFGLGQSAEAAARTVARNQRVLLLVSALSNGSARYRALYEFMEAQGVSQAQSKLGAKYRRIYLLQGVRATRAEFVRSLTSLTSSAENRAVDLFVQTHGGDGILYFTDGGTRTSGLGRDLANTGLNGKARALYSTACYGSTHINDFLAAGFLVGSGSRRVNASSSYEYPRFLTEWGGDAQFGNAIAVADNASARDASDWTAEYVLGYDHVDSQKVVTGRRSTKISLDPTSVR
jgi:hypothetical protein